MKLWRLPGGDESKRVLQSLVARQIWTAAQEILDDLLEPYLVDLKRRITLGLGEAAQ